MMIIMIIMIIHSDSDVHRQSKTVSLSKINAAVVKNEYFLLLNVQTSSFLPNTLTGII